MNCSDKYIGADGQIYEIIRFYPEARPRRVVFKNSLTEEILPMCAEGSPEWHRYAKTKLIVRPPHAAV